MPVYLIATLDTKGHEIQFVRAQLESLGVECRLVNAGCRHSPKERHGVSLPSL